MSETKRGRKSYSDYVQIVAEALRLGIFELDECASLAQLPGVQKCRRQYQHEMLPTGIALQILFDQVVSDIERLAKLSNDPMIQRVAVFLQVWYRERGTVVDAAKRLGLSRSYVAHTIQPRSLEIVAKRFLEIAWNTDIPA